MSDILDIYCSIQMQSRHFVYFSFLVVFVVDMSDVDLLCHNQIWLIEERNIVQFRYTKQQHQHQQQKYNFPSMSFTNMLRTNKKDVEIIHFLFCWFFFSNILFHILLFLYFSLFLSMVCAQLFISVVIPHTLYVHTAEVSYTY